jgi:hypothetical protein
MTHAGNKEEAIPISDRAGAARRSDAAEIAEGIKR